MSESLRRAETRSAPDGITINYPSEHHRSPSLPHHLALSLSRPRQCRAEESPVPQQSHITSDSAPPEIKQFPQSPASSLPPESIPFCSLQSSIIFSPHLSISFPRLPSGPFYDGVHEDAFTHPPQPTTTNRSQLPHSPSSSIASTNPTTAIYTTDGITSQPHIAWGTDLERGPTTIGTEEVEQAKPSAAADEEGGVGAKKVKKRRKAASLWAAVRCKARNDPLAVAGVCAGIVVLPFVIRGSTR
jgi:hypothetical protein